MFKFPGLSLHLLLSMRKLHCLFTHYIVFQIFPFRSALKAIFCVLFTRYTPSDQAVSQKASDSHFSCSCSLFGLFELTKMCNDDLMYSIQSVFKGEHLLDKSCVFMLWLCEEVHLCINNVVIGFSDINKSRSELHFSLF